MERRWPKRGRPKADPRNQRRTTVASSKPNENGSYHHEDLRVELVEAELRLLETRATDDLGLRAPAQRAARIGCRNPEKELSATRLAYVRFAQGHPALFCAMSGNSGSKLLLGFEVGVDSDPTTLRALATAHGLALRMLDGKTRADGKTPDRVSGTAAVQP